MTPYAPPATSRLVVPLETLVTPSPITGPSLRVNGHTLLLNASYEPIAVVSLRRAVVLLLAGKAECLESHPGTWKSASRSVEIPSVIRLRYMVRIPFWTGVGVSRRAVLHRDSFRCGYCAAPADTIDHVIPRSRGGQHSWDNVVAACRQCNGRKGAHTPEEASMTLRVPLRPPTRARAMVYGVTQIDRTWERYLDAYAAA